MTDEQKFELTLAELRAVVLRCEHPDCQNLATMRCGREDAVCDNHKYGGAVDLDDAPTIRAVQARIDGLSESQERWVIALVGQGVDLFVGKNSDYTEDQDDARVWPTQRGALIWSKTYFVPNTFSLVRL
jgi:hypothetical protein